MHLRLRLSLLITFAVLGVAASAAAQTDAPPPLPGSADGATAPVGNPPPGAPPAIGMPPEPPPPPPPVVVTPPPPPPPSAAATPLKIENPSGGTIRFGLLAQSQYEMVGNPTVDGYSHNIFVRRFRILIGGTLFRSFEYFFDTDFADLFKGDAVSGIKTTPGLNIQDAFVTYKPAGDLLKVDVGYMLPPMSHNALQGATTLYGWDYFANSFRHSNAFGTSSPPIGRDAGIQLRGLLFDGHIEFRAGLFQGRREPQAPPPAVPPNPPVVATDVASRNFFRATGRVQINLLDAEPGFFYAGTYLGAKKILSLGGSIDIQDNYIYWAGDAFADLPAGPGVFTAQVNVARWDGDDWLTALPKQTALMAEAGYHFTPLHISPIVRYEQRFVSGADIPTAFDEKRYVGGLAFWAYGHNSNLKVFFSRIKPDAAARGFNQLNVQWQVFFY